MAPRTQKNGSATGGYQNVSFGPLGRATMARHGSGRAAQVKINPYTEIGRTGLRQWGGYVLEEWLTELQGRRGAEMYREMSDQDPVIGGILFAIEMLVRKVAWRIEPGGDQQADQQAAEFLQQCLFEDLQFSWSDTVSEIMSFLPYGYYLCETVFKRRRGETRDPGTTSKFTDGKVGLAKLATRSQDALLHWEFDDHDDWTAMYHQPPPTYTVYRIPREKALLFRTKVHKQNPEGRPLALDTRVPTPQGWATMGTLQPGDQVYDETGMVRTVTGKSEIFRDRPVYEVEFSSGHTVVADACHEWQVTTSNDRTLGRSRVLTTQQLFERQNAMEPVRSDSRSGVRRSASFCCGRAPVLDGPVVDLPLDPYLLGYWLGDGKSSGAAFSCSDPDLGNLLAEIARCGYSGRRIPGTYQVTVRGGLLADLRAAGVLNDKHIPPRYLRASVEQRLALLQGLMDSDGYSPHAKAKDQASVFANSDPRLIRDVRELVRSLGGQPRLRETDQHGSTGGTVRGRVITAARTCYALTFYLPFSAHRLERKRTRQQPKLTLKSCGHFIKSIRHVGTADTVCIEVDSPSHLFLAGDGMVPTHNSILRNAVRPYYFLKNMQNLEGIGVERDLAGYPVLIPPTDVDVWNTNDPAMVNLLAQCQAFVSQVRRDELEGAVIPNGYEFQLLKGGGSRAFNTNDIITRYEQRIATSVLADMILLGQDKVGSYALAGAKKDLFSAALETFLDQIGAVFNTDLIPRLFKLNGLSVGGGLTDWPKLTHGTVEDIDLDTLSALLTALGAAGAPVFAGDVEDRLLDAILHRAGLPSVSEEETEGTSEGE